MALLRFGALFGALALVACGDPLVDGAYRGEPMYSFRGRINDYRDQSQLGLDRYRAAIFWSLNGTTSTATEDLVEQTIAVGNVFPPDVQIELFNPPQGHGLERVRTPYYLGLIYLYEDVDENSRMDDSELRGAATTSALFYAKHDIAASQSPTLTEIPEGYSLVQLPLPCDEPWRISHASLEENCGVSLGRRCEFDDECGPPGSGAKCGSEELPGQCLLPFRESGCWPKQGAYYPEETYEGETYPPDGWYLACDVDADCPEGQQLTCRQIGLLSPDDHYVGACVPALDEPTQIDIFEGIGCSVAPLCVPQNIEEEIDYKCKS